MENILRNLMKGNQFDKRSCSNSASFTLPMFFFFFSLGKLYSYSNFCYFYINDVEMIKVSVEITPVFFHIINFNYTRMHIFFLEMTDYCTKKKKNTVFFFFFYLYL